MLAKRRYLSFALSLPLTLFTVSSVNAELKALGDDDLSGVSGQSGISLELKHKLEIGEVAYFEDGNGIALQGVRLSSSADPGQLAESRLTLDILDSGDLSLTFVSLHQERFQIDEIRFVNQVGVTPIVNDLSIGGFFLDYELEGSLISYNRGNGFLGPNNVIGGLYDVDFTITNGRLGYRTNGNEFLLDGLTLDVESLGTILGATPTNQLNLSTPNLKMELSVDAIRHRNSVLGYGEASDIVATNYGSLWLNLDASADLFIEAGGASGTQGMTINSNSTINRLDVAWGDDTDWVSSGYWVGALGITGTTNLVNMTVDIEDDADAGDQYHGLGMALAFERLEANLHVADYVLGETKSNIDAYVANAATPVKSLGSFGINLVFADGIYDTTPLTNRILVQAGGNTDAGYQGLRLDTQLSLISDDGNQTNLSNFVYTDDGYSLMLSGLEAYVDGDITIDVTSAGVFGTEVFYDGLRIGFEDLAFGYRIEGNRVAEDTGNINDLKSQDLQSAQTLNGFSGLSGMAGHPSLEGTLNGHITLGAGGAEGDEGVTINSDIYVTDGAMATYMEADGTGNGIWLSGLNYDVHLRDMMLDVSSEGLKIYETESWSKLDVTDLKVGGKDTGASFGRLILESYEVASESVISAGGARTVCIGGVGGDQAACEGDSGRWEDRGTQGITVATKKFLKGKIDAEGKRNRFTWETDRTDEGLSSVQNGTGLTLVFDNFTTNDGVDGSSDTFGIQTTYNMDVARTVVVKKSTGVDSNGVYGEKGWEKVMLSNGSYTYMDPASMTDADRANRPVGIAMRTNTQFKELDFESVKLGHSSGGESTLLYGLKLQNFNVTTDITATPLD